MHLFLYMARRALRAALFVPVNGCPNASEYFRWTTRIERSLRCDFAEAARLVVSDRFA